MQRMNTNSEPAATPGSDWGQYTRRSACQWEAPSEAAACMCRSGIVRMIEYSGRIMKGSSTWTMAMMVPVML